MKIQTILLNELGPFENRIIDLSDDWSGEISRHILFSGPNGSGKSIVLRAIATLWDATGYWLDSRKLLPQGYPARIWLWRWGGVAVILRDLPHAATPVGLIFGNHSWFEQLEASYPNTQWLGETVERTGRPQPLPPVRWPDETVERPKLSLMIPNERWLDDWAEARKKMIVTFQDPRTPNLIHLDAEERRWVSPKRNLGKPMPEDSSLRWLVAYKATQDWKGQLEASLINLKTVMPKKYRQVIRDLNAFLVGKGIDPAVRPGENRLRVTIEGQRGQWHAIDDLSAGEHQVLIQIYLVSRWLESGGIVMIDEPDLHLHPSLTASFLARLESLVDERNGQLLVTSHDPDVWQRYESRDKRIQLGGAL
jgi:energy-coupling factor transporter ATP-binding protein EcfA2